MRRTCVDDVRDRSRIRSRLSGEQIVSSNPHACGPQSVGRNTTGVLATNSRAVIRLENRTCSRRCQLRTRSCRARTQRIATYSDSGARMTGSFQKQHRNPISLHLEGLRSLGEPSLHWDLKRISLRRCQNIGCPAQVQRGDEIKARDYWHEVRRSSRDECARTARPLLPKIQRRLETSPPTDDG